MNNRSLKFIWQPFIALSLCLAMAIGVSENVQATTCIWEGDSSTDWYDVDNWSGCLDSGGNPKLPGGSDDVTIPAYTTYYPVLTRYQDVIVINSLTINALAQLTIDEQTTISANQVFNAGTITIVETTGHLLRINAPFHNDGTVNFGSEAALILYEEGTHTGSFSGRQLSFYRAGTGNQNQFLPSSSISVNALSVGDNHTVTVAGQFNCQQNIYIYPDAIVDLSAAQIINLGTVNLRGGKLIADTIAIPSGEIFSGMGTLETDLINAGTLSPGSSPGALMVDGNYSQEASGAFSVELGGITAGSEYDQLAVTGSAELAGDLDVVLIDEFLPLSGQSFILMTYADSTGTFNTVNLPPVTARMEWTLDYTETALRLSLVEKDALNNFLPLFVH